MQYDSSGCPVFRAGDRLHVEDLDEDTALEMLGKPIWFTWREGETKETELVVSEVDIENDVVILNHAVEAN